jgi:hypothetical protein
MTRLSRRLLPPRAEHPLLVGSTLVTVAVTALAMKATAGMRGQTIRELVLDRH